LRERIDPQTALQATRRPTDPSVDTPTFKVPLTYEGFPHGMPTTQAETVNADLLAFING